MVKAAIGSGFLASWYGCSGSDLLDVLVVEYMISIYLC